MNNIVRSCFLLLMALLSVIPSYAADPSESQSAGLIGSWLWRGGTYGAYVHNALGGYVGTNAGTQPAAINDGVWIGTNGTACPRLGTNDCLGRLSACTVSVWVRDYSGNGISYKELFGRYVAATTNRQVILYYNGTAPGFQIFGQPGVPSATNWYTIFTDSAISAQYRSITNRLWHHVVATYSAPTNLIVWQNGVKFVRAVTQQATTSGVSSIASLTTIPMVVGVGNSIGSRSWNGAITELRVYSRVLPDAEILELYIDGRAQGRVP